MREPEQSKPLWQMSVREFEAFLDTSMKKALLNHKQLIEAEQAEEDLLSRKEVLEKFDIAPSTLYEWIKSGYLPKPVRKGRRVYFRKSEINKKYDSL